MNDQTSDERDEQTVDQMPIWSPQVFIKRLAKGGRFWTRGLQIVAEPVDAKAARLIQYLGETYPGLTDAEAKDILDSASFWLTFVAALTPTTPPPMEGDR